MSPRLHFHFITLFPETIGVWLETSILGRARKERLFDYDLYQLRDFSTDKHRSVDDSAYGGGGGMVLRIEPLAAAVEAIAQKTAPQSSRVIYFSPAGRRLDAELLAELGAAEPGGKTSSPQHFTFVCGHYEGVDQRFLDHFVDLEVSLGDFVLTGGELPAVALADALIRQLEGTLGCSGAKDQESFSLRAADGESRLLEYPHYTRPPEFRGWPVPEILRQGDHGKIRNWREQRSLEQTRARRPDLLR